MKPLSHKYSQLWMGKMTEKVSESQDVALKLGFKLLPAVDTPISQFPHQNCGDNTKVRVLSLGLWRYRMHETGKECSSVLESVCKMLSSTNDLLIITK